MNTIDFEFVPPPEAPVFEPTADEFKDPLAYIAKIRPIAEQTGICKIKPPAQWQPPFAVDVDNFRFTPRMQRLNELEATTRVKLNFLDQIAKFWELQGSSLKIPNVERKALDLFTLYRVVLEEGGSDVVSRERRWSRIATRMGYPPGRGVGTLLRTHFERILYPYHVFQEGTSIGEIVNDKCINEDSDESEDKDYIPHGIPSRQAIRPPPDRYARRSKRRKEAEEEEDIVSTVDTERSEARSEIDYSTNNELKKLQFYGAGPKMPGFYAQGQIPMASDEESKAQLKEKHIEVFKDVKMGQGARDLKMGFMNKTGNFLKETKTIGAVEAAKLGSLLKKKERPRGKTPIEQIVCTLCKRGDDEASMLLCDGCDDSYHTFCLIPPLPEIPKGDWRCPCCVAKEVNKPQEAFGFEQAQREYTLQEFGLKADEFKTTYFNMPVHRVPYSLVEKEFWRIVNAVDEDVTVEYGADLHTINHGSGFPNTNTKSLLPGDEDYVTSGWNLNNLPVLEGSVLKHIHADISGMKIPWTYVGMCFATFCWHNEDHWSYSINYLHWGEPKTWYGVPGGKAEAFEEAMRSVAPELFDSQPDLLHQLVTIMNPNLLIKLGVPICRTNQIAGEFVITFPRSYHAGFNQGYNFAEAVNFAPADWLPIGRVCVSHYGMLHRFCVFSHDELVCKMASDPDRLDISIAASTYQDMLRMVDIERDMRKTLLEWGVTQAYKEVFELLADDERQCDYCKTTCFLSAVTCSCKNDNLVCIPHKDKLCHCPPSNHILMYRYTLDELPSMLNRLKVRAESFDCWAAKVENALNAPPNNKMSILDFKELIQEAEEKRFPQVEFLSTLQNVVDEGEKCAAMAQQLLSKKVRTRTRAGDIKTPARLALDELKIFNKQLVTLACEIKEAYLVKDLLERAIKFEADAKGLLDDEKADSKKLEKYLELGTNLDIDIAEIPRLKQKLQQSKWLEEVQTSLLIQEQITLEVLRRLIDKGINVPPHPTVERVMAQLQELLTYGEHWEDKAREHFQATSKRTLMEVENTVREAGTISVHLPNVLQLIEYVRKAKDWIHKVQVVQKKEHIPYLDVVEYLVTKGKSIPIHLDQLSQLCLHADNARIWRDKVSRTFLKKNSQYTLLEILAPRKDIGNVMPFKGKKKKPKEFEDTFGDETVNWDKKIDDAPDPAILVDSFKEAGRKELESMILLRLRNIRKHSEDSLDARYCICRKPSGGHMLQCDLCKDWFHLNCIPNTRPGSRGREGRFLCPCCVRSRRPRMETILNLLMALQKLGARVPEGEALQCLTERGMSWQDRAKTFLQTEEVSAALATLSAISQHMSQQAYTEKSEKIISTELLKAANNPELKPHIQNVAHSAFAGLLSQSKKESTPEWGIECSNGDQKLQPLAPVNEFPTVQEFLSTKCNTTLEMKPEQGSEPMQIFHEGSNASDNDVSSNYNMEHAYSTVSKPAATPVAPRKHSRKSPLVTRQMESPILQLSEKTQLQLENLLMEGDLLEMTLDQSHAIWKILQATKLTRDSFTISPFTEIEDHNAIRIERMKKKKLRLGDIKDSSRPKKSKLLLKEKQAKKLRLGGKLFKEKVVKKVGKGEFSFRKEMKDGTIKTVKMRAKFLERKKPRKDRKNSSTRDSEIDESCSAAGCLRPIGEAVNWVQCDGGCEQWFHLLCVGLDVTEVSETEDYICPNCRPKAAVSDASESKQDTIDLDSEMAVSVLAGLAKNSFERSTPTLENS